VTSSPFRARDGLDVGAAGHRSRVGRSVCCTSLPHTIEKPVPEEPRRSVQCGPGRLDPADQPARPRGQRLGQHHPGSTVGIAVVGSVLAILGLFVTPGTAEAVTPYPVCPNASTSTRPTPSARHGAADLHRPGHRRTAGGRTGRRVRSGARVPQRRNHGRRRTIRSTRPASRGLPQAPEPRSSSWRQPA
jgi:hypothetical protein